MAKLPRETLKAIALAVKAYELKRSDFEADATNLQNRLLANASLKALVHSLKWRAKDPEHLRDKLKRMALRALAEGAAFDVTPDNLFDRVPDLAGVRLLHLNMRQMEQIHPQIMRVFADEGYVVSGDPEAKTWDLEYEQMFKALGLTVIRNESLYTSVHYVVKQNTTTRRLCELQVRTLAEEVWGEISHTINYPHETNSVACKEQLKVLARVVSGCSRLVDSIVASYADHQKQAARTARVRRRPVRAAAAAAPPAAQPPSTKVG